MAITKDMKIQEIIDKYPYTADVFFKHGIMCIGCVVAQFENLEEGALAHGIDPDALLKDLNKSVEDYERAMSREEENKEEGK
ncbi:MAG: DUF1858 domain-containing protein [bacterium]